MYGLLLESLACFIKEKYGEEKWEEIRRAAKVEQTSFSTHSVYPENLIPKLSTKAMEVSLYIRVYTIRSADPLKLNLNGYENPPKTVCIQPRIHRSLYIYIR